MRDDGECQEIEDGDINDWIRRDKKEGENGTWMCEYTILIYNTVYIWFWYVYIHTCMFIFRKMWLWTSRGLFKKDAAYILIYYARCTGYELDEHIHVEMSICRYWHIYIYLVGDYINVYGWYQSFHPFTTFTDAHIGLLIPLKKEPPRHSI